MKEIKKYTDIIRYGHPSTTDVLKPGDIISITEKLDGANGQFAPDDGTVYKQSRKTVVNDLNTLRGFNSWVDKNIATQIENLNSNYRYFGEWLVSHKVNYKKEYYNDFYLIGIYDEEKQEYLSHDEVLIIAKKLNIKTVPVLYYGPFISYEHLMSFVGKSEMTETPDEGEGIVVKNTSYKDRYGKQCFVKLVTEKFAEVQKQRLPKKPTALSEEALAFKSICTKPRIEKIMLKLVDENVFTIKDFCIENMGKLIKTVSPLLKEDLYKEEPEMLNNVEEKQIEKMIGKTMPLLIKEILKEY